MMNESEEKSYNISKKIGFSINLNQLFEGVFLSFSVMIATDQLLMYVCPLLYRISYRIKRNFG